MSPQGGHLYIFNESPRGTGGPRSMNVLFPSPTSNDGSAGLDGGQTVTIPDRGDGFVFDKEKGVEKLWIIWSAGAQPRPGRDEEWANERDRGRDQGRGRCRRPRHVPAGSRVAGAATRRSTRAGMTTLSAPAAVFVKLIELEHQ